MEDAEDAMIFPQLFGVYLRKAMNSTERSVCNTWQIRA